jgi:hypothetical protein
MQKESTSGSGCVTVRFHLSSHDNFSMGTLQFTCSNLSLTNTSVAAVSTSGFRFSVYRFHFVCLCIRLLPEGEIPTMHLASCLSHSGKLLAGKVVCYNSRSFCFVSSLCEKMVDNISIIYTQYKERLRAMYKLARFSQGHRMVRSDGAPNRAFFHNLFNDHSMATEFLKDIGLIRRTMQCDSCGQDMKWSERQDINDGVQWRCQRRVAGARCNWSASIRHGSWFQHSRLTLEVIILLTYDIVCREQVVKIQMEYCFSEHTVAAWGMFVEK